MTVRTRPVAIRRPLIASAALRLLAAAATILALAPIPAAQAQSDPAPAARGNIESGAFKALVDGNTVYFELEDGSLWGREYYRPGTNETVFIVAETGECLKGFWRLEGERYCYYYRDRPSCWLTYYEGDRIVVEAPDGMRQRVRKIVSNEPLSCEKGLVSQVLPPLPGPVQTGLLR